MIVLIVMAAVLAALIWIVCAYDNGYGGFASQPVVARPSEQRPDGILETVMIPAADGEQLEGWLFVPAGQGRVPLLLMAPGLTGTKDGHLEPLAWRFVAAGWAVLLFDFRCFGGSSGQPRHWVDLGRHAADYAAVLSYAQDKLAVAGRIDAERIALWGSSFSAGSAIVAAARAGAAVHAVVAQVPFLDTPPAQQPRPTEMARYTLWTVLDLLRMRLGSLTGVQFEPVYIPAFGKPDEGAFARSVQNPSMYGGDAEMGSEFWRTMPPLRGGWQNKMLARMLASFDELVPLHFVEQLSCPLHLIAASRDDLVPQSFVEDAYARARHAQKRLSVHDCSHFDLYLGQWRELVVSEQIEFLNAVASQKPTRVQGQ